MGLLEGIRLPPTNWAATGLRQARERQGGTLGSGVSADPPPPADAGPRLEPTVGGSRWPSPSGRPGLRYPPGAVSASVRADAGALGGAAKHSQVQARELERQR